MKKLIFIFFIFLASQTLAQKPFSNCSAAFLDKKMIVEKYDDFTKAKISITAKGTLQASTAELSDDNTKMTGTFPFGIAIKNKETGTVMLFSRKTYKNINIEKVLALCNPGDSIILLTLNNEFALPHNEILVY